MLRNIHAQILLVLILSSSLSSCAWFNELTVHKISEPKPQLNLAMPKPVKVKPLQWFVVTPETYRTIFDKLRTKKYNLVLFGLTDDGYENLSINMAELQKYIIEQTAIIKGYKNYYELNPIEPDINKQKE